MPDIDVHPAIAHFELEREVEASLRANELNPKLLYVTPRQTELWRQVFLKHSPIHGNPEFARIYHDAYVRLSAELSPGKIWLVGLGCGTGLKERELCSQLKPGGHEVAFSAIDVSRDLVAESAHRLKEAGAESGHHLVCDLGETPFIKQWLAGVAGATPIIFTLFGLVPNLPPALVVRLMRELLRPGDVMLVSAHLAPMGEGVDLPTAMRKVLPQYDNAETHAWLGAAIYEWGLPVSDPKIVIGEIENVPAFIAEARGKAGVWRLFHSLRYTPELFEKLLCDAGFKIKRLSMTACREEAIWSVQL
jgi:SAM-dependent methyltransferase